MKNKLRKISIFKVIFGTILILILLSPFYLIFKRYSEIEYEKEHSYREYVSNDQKNSSNAKIATPPGSSDDKTQKNDVPLPEKIMIDVPFTTQAPLVNWDALHEEACEEASLIMVNSFLSKKSLGSAQDVDTQILSLIDYENKHGYQVDVTTNELNEIAKNHFNMRTGRVMENFSTTDLKKELASGRPVIIPAAGKLLQNPNFRGGGPIYHMLVIKGYDKDGFITNDPGTRNGNGYRYGFDLLFDAIHNWNKDNILNGPKSYLVFDQS